MVHLGRKLANSASFMMLVLFLASCGGGGGEKKPEPTATISANPQLSVNENEDYSFTVSARNFKTTTISFSANNLPAWAQINESTGAVSGTPSYDDAGVYSNITITATGGNQTASLSSFQIEVVNVNRLPVLVEPPLMSIAESVEYSDVINIDDADGDDIEVIVNGLPDWLSFNADSNTLVGTPSLDDAGTYSDITISANDGSGEIELTNVTITVENSILISGKVIDGYIEGAIVFLDENLNFQIDESELNTVTDVNGSYSLVVTPAYIQSAAISPLRALIADGAKDSSRPELDFSQTPIIISTSPLTMLTADMESFEQAYISPFTNLVAKELETAFVSVSIEELTITELADLISNQKETVFNNAFSAINIDAGALEINHEDMISDLFNDFIAELISIPKVFQTSIITLAEHYTDIVVSEQDQRDSDNDGIANNVDSDDDGDGVLDVDDAFPLDPLESQDSDNDGVGDNSDSYPQDDTCYAESDGNGGQCYLTWMADQNIDFVKQSSGGLVYFFSRDWSSILIFNSATKHFSPAIAVNAAFSIEYLNSHQRLYVGFVDGTIQYLDDENELQNFATVGESVYKFVAVDNYLLSISGYGAEFSLFTINGELSDSSGSRANISRDYAWDETNSKLYYFRDGTSPNDLHYITIDVDEGTFVDSGESPYHGDYSIQPPITIANDGSKVMLGSGDIYVSESLTWQRSISTRHDAAYWNQNDELITISTENGSSELTRRDVDFNIIEQKNFDGRILNVFTREAGSQLVFQSENHVFFSDYLPSDDSDNDGVNNNEDAFPLDIAASIDSDNDGYPDEWNLGYTQYDTTTGLTLDIYPLDSACWLTEHGNANGCDYGATVPNFTPEQLVFDDSGNIYLLHREGSKIYRWSSATNDYSNPVQISTLINTTGIIPNKIAYSAAHNRIYIGYQNGVITFIDLAQAIREQYFASIAKSVGGLTAVGDYVLAQDSSGAWNTHYILDQEGSITDNEDWNQYSQTYAWNETFSKVFFLRDGTSPNDLHFETIDQSIGAITDKGDSPYHSSNGIRHPVRVSFDDSKVMLGSGNIFDAQDLTLVGELSGENNSLALKDHQWLANEIVTIELINEQTKLKIWSDDDYQLQVEFDIDGEPLAIVPNSGDLVVVSKIEQGLLFTPQVIADKDQDGLPAWWEEHYQLDDNDASDAVLDTDSDGLSNLQEFSLRTNPTVSDTDNDGLSDGEEVNDYGTEPLNADSDNDGLSDGAEVNDYGTDPLTIDSDEDGLTDSDELLTYLSNPLLADSDSDGLDDLYEVTFGLNPNENDAQSDFDNDGLVNIDEFNEGTNPTIPDSDFDGLNDGLEVHTHLTNPLVKDSDNDRMPDGFEITHSFAPNDNQDGAQDADLDGYTNMEEYFLSTDPNDIDSVVTIKSWTAYQGNAAHDGFVPITINSDDISLRWTIAAFGQNNQVVAENGRLFIANNNSGENWLSAHNATNGQEIWRKHYDEAGQMVTPAVENERVFVQTRSGADYLRALEASSGSLYYREDHGNYGHYGSYGPVADNNAVYVYDGYRGVYALNESGERQWSYSLNYSAAYSAPTVNDNFVFIFDRGLQVLNRQTGESAYKIDFPENIITTNDKYNAIVAVSDESALAVESSTLFRFDLRQENISWQIDLGNINNLQKQVSYAYGRIYAISGGVLSIFDENSGELLWSWEAPNNEQLRSNMVLTRNLVFIGSQNSTYAIDLSSHTTVWQTQYTGQLSLSNEGALYIAGSEEVVAFSVSGDSDRDGMPDWWEIAYGLDIDDEDDANSDSDNDGLSNLEEFQSSTIPNIEDTDGDGLTDGEEVNTYNTEPLIADSDNDGLTDGEEVNTHLTDPLEVDSDSDGLSDYQEVITYESNPLSEDSDSDGMSDEWEVTHELDVNSDDAQLDADSDTLVNIDEFVQNTDPNQSDSDNDGLTDGAEVHTHLTNPLNRDSDQDRMTDAWEIDNGFNPLVNTDALEDSDSDGFANFEEFYLVTNPNDVDDFAVNEPWVTFQANANHDGFVVQHIESDLIDEMWRVDLNNIPHQVVAAQGKVFVTNNSYFGEHNARAYNSVSGTLLWENSYPNIHSLNPPAWANGMVFYQTGGHGDSFLRGVDASSGEVNFASSYGNQWSNYLAPTPYNDNIYIAGGYYGGAYAFDENGSELFFTDLPQIDRWTPVVDEEKIYACTSTSLTIMTRTSGAVETTLTSNNTDNWRGCSSNTSVVKGSINNLIAINNQSLQYLDLSSNSISWYIDSSFSGQASISYGRIYVIRNGVLSVYDEATGTLLWSFEAPEGGSFNSNIVLTRNVAFVANGTKTYAIDLDSHLTTWNADVSGHLSLSEGVLYVAGNQQLVAFNVDGDDDSDGLPNWWELNHGLDPDSSDDASTDSDSDGLTNLEEYTHGTNPIDNDSDDDDLTDGDEINTYASNPLDTDSDNDGLFDGAEVNTYNTNPILVDTDGDTFSDGDEVNLYQTDPADENSVPEALTSLTESFEDESIPTGWSQSINNVTDWFLTDSDSSDGNQSLRAGDIDDSEESIIEYRNLFSAGTFSFKARVESESCCDSLEVYVDDVLVYRLNNAEWESQSIELSSGEHIIKFRYEKDGSVSSGADTAWIDEVEFVQ